MLLPQAPSCIACSWRVRRGTKALKGIASTAVRTPARVHICATAWLSRASFGQRSFGVASVRRKPSGKPASASKRRAASGSKATGTTSGLWPKAPAGSHCAVGAPAPSITCSASAFRLIARERARRTRSSRNGFCGSGAPALSVTSGCGPVRE